MNLSESPKTPDGQINEMTYNENRLEQNGDMKLLVTALEIGDGSGYYRLSIPASMSSEAFVSFIKKHISDADIIIHQVENISFDENNNHDDNNEFLKWIWEIQKTPDNSKSKKTIFIVDLSKVTSEMGVDSYFAEMNAKRDKIACNPNGPTLVITPCLSHEMERFIHSLGDLRSCCSGQYTYKEK